ncbi:MAG: hypothetical protein ABT01_00385 [Clostridium sp. SCN 57-10]|nr:MAG: hypothetical protein ABT01_00385 [Clostridium sp. SCN 57-10]
MTNEEIIKQITEIEQRARSNTKRIDKLEQTTTALSELATAVKVMVTKQNYIADKVDGLDEKVSELEGKPGKRWETLAEKLIWLLAAAVVGYALSRAGLA